MNTYNKCNWGRIIRICMIVFVSLLFVFLISYIIFEILTLHKYQSKTIILLCNFIIFGLIFMCLIENQIQENKRMDEYKNPKSHINLNEDYKPDSLDNYKQMQWNLVYYSLLLYGAVFSLWYLSNDPNLNKKIFQIPNCILLISVLIIFDFSIYIITDLQFKIVQQRIIRIRFKKWYKDCHFFHKDNEINEWMEKDKKFFRDFRITGFIYLLQLLSTGLLVYLCFLV